MAGLDFQAFIARLNACCRRAMDEAASLCVANAHREVTIEHFLIGLLKQEGADARILLQASDADPNVILDAVQNTFQRFRKAEADRTPAFSPLLYDLLQDAWLFTSVELEEPQIRSGAVLVALLRDPGRYTHMEYYARMQSISGDDLARRFADLTAGSVETDYSNQALQGGNSDTADASAGDSALTKFGTNFTELARNGQIDPIFCRDLEIRQIIEILCRRRKNNPICVGEAGVGKTALAEGMAVKIAEGDVPESLRNVELWGLDVGALQAGAALKGEFEKRLKAVIEEVKASPIPIVLFIDEAHTLIGAGGDKGGSDAANLLKPALARGELKTIAATTWSEYKTYFEKDPALTRRFQLVKLDEPSIDQAVVILRGLKPAYEKSHGVYITDEALKAAARLSARYITGRQLPDKAIDVIDTACARVKASGASIPFALEERNQEHAMLTREAEGIDRDARTGSLEPEQIERRQAITDRLAELDEIRQSMSVEFDSQRQLAEQFLTERGALLSDVGEGLSELEATAGSSRLLQMRKDLQQTDGSQSLVSIEVGPEEIAAIIGDWTGIPVSSMVEDDYQRLLTLSETMKKTVKGQDHALEAIESRLRASRLDLHKKGQPLGVFFLAGPSGVGKTETALEVARQLFGSERFVTTINMSEYQERHTLSRLIGSPPGYVGYGEGGVLTEAMRKKPYSVVLLDEVEKADVNVLNLFYQAFDKGEVADGEGRIIDCKNIVFFLTSNLGSDQIENWVATAEDGKIPSAETMAKSLQPLFAQHFKPALLARMEPIVYLPLSDQVMGEIVDMKLEGLIDLLKENQKLDLAISETGRTRIKSMCGMAANGARLVDQVIQKQLLPALALEILEAGQNAEVITKIEIDSPDEGGFTFATSFADLQEQASSDDDSSLEPPQALSA